MKQQMTFSRFEEINQQLIGFLPRIKDKSTLLMFANFLLEGELAFIIERGGNNENKRILLGVYPKEDREWAKENFEILYSWYGNVIPGPELPGYHKESELEVGGRTFTDALVAFGGIVPRTSPPLHELIVLQSAHATERYSSYHCWAAAALLRHFEQIEAIKCVEQQRTWAKAEHERAEQECKEKEQYARIVDLEVLRDETWDQFSKRLKKYKNEKLEDMHFMGASAVLWTGYQVRDSRELKRENSNNNRINPECALTWFKEKTGNDTELIAKYALYEYAMESLLKTKPLTKDLIRDNKLDLSNAYLKKATIVTVEHAWYFVKEASFQKKINIREIKNELDALFSLTNTLIIMELIQSGKSKPLQNSDPVCDIHINRNTMRIYLAYLLINAPQLRKRYVGLNQGDYPFLVPPEVQRQFIVNLSRFMLGVIEILEQENGVDIEPPSISRVEFLDSLLYLIDRYSHVELQVDERINIREHLGRGFSAEVKLHLTQSFYRDHLLHVIDVFLMGHMLLNTYFDCPGGTNLPFIEYISNLLKSSTPVDLLREWAVAALLHDIGYQLASKLKNSEMYHNFFQLCGNIYPDWLDSKAEACKKLEEFAAQLISHFKEIESCCNWLPEKGESYELSDHGILSSLRVAQVLAHAGAQGQPVGQPIDPELLGKYSHALYAIAHHNLFNHKISLASHPLAVLLRICDELQEWGRRRVNIEQIVKHLYLKIEEMDNRDLPATENLERMETNLCLRKINIEEADRIKISLRKDKPEFFFRLVYRNPVEAHLDSTTTFLSKAYNWQHVDMKSETSGSIEFRIELVFPVPQEYYCLSELDIYGLFTERIRSLPLLFISSNIFEAPPGMVQLISGEKHLLMDQVGIIIKGEANPINRKSWLPCNPDSFFDDFMKFKKNLLIGRALDKEK